MITGFNSRNITKFGRGGAAFRGKEALSNEIMQHVAPSIFAEDKHESRSDKYTYIPTIKVLDALRNEGFEPFEVRQGGTRIPGKEHFTKHMIRLRHASSMQLQADEVFRELILLNSHDGTSSYQLMSGLFRVVCSNGLIRAQGEAKLLRVPHKGDIVSRVIEGAYEIIDDSKSMDDQVSNFQNVILSPTEQRILASSAAIARFEDVSPVEPDQILRPRRRDDNANDLWSTFNRVQENLVQGGLHYIQCDEQGRRVAHRYTRPVQSVDSNVKLNQALWALASEMQKLKAA